MNCFTYRLACSIRCKVPTQVVERHQGHPRHDPEVDFHAGAIAHQPEPPPPPPPPPEEPPPLLPPLSLEPGAVEAEAMVVLRSLPRWSAKPTGSLVQELEPAYQVAAAAVAPAAASTPAKRVAQVFSTSSAIA